MQLFNGSKSLRHNLGLSWNAMLKAWQNKDTQMNSVEFCRVLLMATE